MMSFFSRPWSNKWLDLGDVGANSFQNIFLLIGFSLFVALGLSVIPVYAFVLLPALFSWLVNRRKLSLVFALWGVYFSYVLLSSFWSGVGGWDYLEKVKHSFYIFLFVYALSRYSDYSDGVWLFVISLGIAFSIEVYSIFHYISLHGFTIWMERFPRIYGLIGIENPIYISSIIAISTVAIVSSFDRIGKSPLLLACAFIICAVVIIPLQTRASLLGLCVGFLILLFQMRKYKLLIGFILIGMVVGLFLLTEIDRFASNKYPRLDIWLYAYDRVVSSCSFIFGCGFLSDFEISLHGRNYSQFHSLFLSQFFYGGLLGFVIFIGVVLFTLYKMYMVKSKWLPVLCAGLTMLLTMRHEIINNPDITWILLWSPIGLSGVLLSSSLKEEGQVS